MNSTGKPGWQTTEFGVTVATLIVGAVVLIFKVPVSEIEAAITNIGAILMSALAVWKYTDSRTQVKMTEAETEVQHHNIERQRDATRKPDDPGGPEPWIVPPQPDGDPDPTAYEMMKPLPN